MLRRKKGSFFERLTGAINTDDHEEFSVPITDRTDRRAKAQQSPTDAEHAWREEAEAELTVDVHHNPDEIVIETIVAGTEPNDLDVSVTREMVTISGFRHKTHEVSDEDYFHRELYWGAFSRKVLLPEEIDVEGSKAILKDGVLSLRLPKADRYKKAKLEIKRS